MSKTLIAGLAVVFLSAGVLTFVTAGSPFSRKDDKKQSKESDDGKNQPSQLADADGTGEDWKNIKWIKEFELTERSGKKFDSRSMDGQVWVASFFFASCPVECVNQNNQVAALAREFGPKGVTFVSITCDPENDSPARLRDYANRFKADEKQWLFLTGDQLHIRRIGAERFALGVDKATHSSRLVVVDRNGEVRGRFRWETPAELTKLKLMLHKCLGEKPSTGEKKSV